MIVRSEVCLQRDSWTCLVDNIEIRRSFLLDQTNSKLMIKSFTAPILYSLWLLIEMFLYRSSWQYLCKFLNNSCADNSTVSLYNQSLTNFRRYINISHRGQDDRRCIIRKETEMVTREQVSLPVIQDAKAPLNAYSQQLTPRWLTLTWRTWTIFFPPLYFGTFKA